MKRNLTIFMSCTGIILLLAGARWDLAISDALYAPEHPFAILLQDGWPLIMKLALALCFALIADRRPAAYIGWGGATLLFAQEASRIFPRPSASVTFLLAMTCALFLCLFLRRRLSPAQKARIRPFLIAYLQLLFTVLIITGVLKLLWGRIRYRQMEDAAQFCVWYRPCAQAGTSFPSGHTSTLACTLLFLFSMLLPRFYPQRHLLACCICAGIFLMMFSRIVMGAHFLSDTAAGMLIALACWKCCDRQWERLIGSKRTAKP